MFGLSNSVNRRLKFMNNFAMSYKYISEIIQSPQEHNLSQNEIEALTIAQNALLLSELLGLSIQTDSENST